MFTYLWYQYYILCFVQTPSMFIYNIHFILFFFRRICMLSKLQKDKPCRIYILNEHKILCFEWISFLFLLHLIGKEKKFFDLQTINKMMRNTLFYVNVINYNRTLRNIQTHTHKNLNQCLPLSFNTKSIFNQNQKNMNITIN